MQSLDLFWKYEFDLPKGSGFALFGMEHMVWLSLIIGLGFWLLFLYMKMNNKNKQRLEGALGLSMVGWIILLNIYLSIIDQFSKYELPCHICSIMGSLCGAHLGLRLFEINGRVRNKFMNEFISKVRDGIGQCLYSLGLPASILAIVFPNWNMYPAFSFKSLEGFLFHAGIIWYVSLMLYSKQIIPGVRETWKAIVVIGSILTGLYILDIRMHVNYGFLMRPSKGSPLVMISKVFGSRFYLWIYLLVIILGMFLMNIVYELFVIKNKKPNC